MKPIFYLDCPDPKATTDDHTWINVDTFDTRAEAVAYIESHWGSAAADHADLFIAEGEL